MQIFLSPASISYLAQFIISFVVTVYLALRLLWRRQGGAQLALLVGFLFSLTLFSGLLFLDTTLAPDSRLFAVYLENPVLALGLLCLSQFVYRFPVAFQEREGEARFVLWPYLAYALYEIYYAAGRFVELLQYGNVDYRPAEADYALAGLFLWIPVAFLRQAVLADNHPAAWPRKLWNPKDAGARAARDLALISMIPLALGIVNILRGNGAISTAILNASLSLGILGGLWLFINIYVNSQPVFTSFLSKLSGATLTLALLFLGSTGWVVAPAFSAEYRPRLAAEQSLRFMPNGLGGYDIAEIPYSFETNLGEKLSVTSRGDGRNHHIDFAFPFYGKIYSHLYVTSVGLIRMDEPLYHPNLQYRDGQFPGIFALLIDLEPASGGGVFAKVEADRLIVTWNDLAAVHHQRDRYTFQAVLYRDGRFDLNYKSLPGNLSLDPDMGPSSSIWLRGFAPGMPGQIPRTVDLSTAARGGPQGLLQDFSADFRIHLDRIMRPLAWLLLGASLFLLGMAPLLLNDSITRPLNALLNSVKEMDEGRLNLSIHAWNLDEIGILTRAFDDQMAWIQSLIAKLEERVKERTLELQSSNERLRNEMDERAAAEGELIQQQRVLAAVEEREQLGRRLHDEIGQAIGLVGVQAGAAQALLEKGEAESARENLENILRAAENARLRLRHYILGMEDSPALQRSFYGMLRESLRVFSQAWGIETVFSPSQTTLPILPETVENQLLHIIQEALVNVRKHAGARRVEVMVTSSPDEVVFIISDDGRGFEPRQGGDADQKGFGLGIMRERVEQVGGRLEVRSAAGQGTRLLVHIPRLSLSAENDPEKPGNLRILLVDSQPLFLDGMRSLLASRGLAVIGTATSGAEALDQVSALRPEAVLLNIRLPDLDGVEVTCRIKAAFPDVRVVLMIDSEEERLVDALQCGASGYLLKSLDANRVFATLADILRGKPPSDSGLASRLLADFNRTAAAQRPAAFRADTVPSELTMRQWDVLRLVARGLTYKEVGAKLGLTERAIKYHMEQIAERLQVNSREQALEYMKRFQEKQKK